MTHRVIAAALSIGAAASIGAAIALAPPAAAQDTHRQPGVERHCMRVQIWPDPPPFAAVTPSRLQSVCEYAVPHKFNPPPPFPFLNDLR